VAVAVVLAAAQNKKFGFFKCQIGRYNPFILKAEDKSFLTNTNTCA